MLQNQSFWIHWKQVTWIKVIKVPSWSVKVIKNVWLHPRNIMGISWFRDFPFPFEAQCRRSISKLVYWDFAKRAQKIHPTIVLRNFKWGYQTCGLLLTYQTTYQCVHAVVKALVFLMCYFSSQPTLNTDQNRQRQIFCLNSSSFKSCQLLDWIVLIFHK